MNAVTDSVGVFLDVTYPDANSIIVVPAQEGKWHRIMRMVLTVTYEDEDDTKFHDFVITSNGIQVWGTQQITHGSDVSPMEIHRRWVEAKPSQAIEISIGAAGRLTGTLTVYTVDNIEPEETP